MDINKNMLFRLIDTASNNEETFSGFNSNILNSIFIDNWDCGIFFIEGHKFFLDNKSYLMQIQEDKSVLNSKFNEVHSFFEDKGIHTSFKYRDVDDLFCWYYRTQCRKRCKKNMECFSECSPQYLFPDVIADYLSDYLLFEKVGAVGYYKQFEATIYSEYILKEVYGIQGAPQLLTCISLNPLYGLSAYENIIAAYCSKNNLNFDAYIKACNDSHCSIFYHILLQGFDNVLNYLKTFKGEFDL